MSDWKFCGLKYRCQLWYSYMSCWPEEYSAATSRIAGKLRSWAGSPMRAKLDNRVFVGMKRVQFRCCGVQLGLYPFC